MAQWFDEKFIHLVAPQLGYFHKQSRTTFTFRCIFCGDSAKRLNKTRGYFFLHRQNYFFKCHNCNESLSFRTFLKRVAPDLHQEYQLERFRQERASITDVIAPLPTFQPVIQEIGIPTIASLPDSHLAKVYCLGRGLPTRALEHLYFTDQWSEWVTSMGWSYKLPKDASAVLVLPWFSREGKLQGAQGRKIDAEGKAGRYMTLKADDSVKAYGLDRVDLTRPIYVVEGPLDSWFLPNAVAAMGSDLMRVHDDILSEYNACYIWDNEPRNKDVCTEIHKAVKMNLPVVIWPPNLELKDLNDMSQAGIDVPKLVSERTFQGLQAEIEFTQWCKTTVMEPKQKRSWTTVSSVS